MIADKRAGGIGARHTQQTTRRLLLSSTVTDEASIRFGSVERPGYGKEQQQRDDRGREPDPPAASPIRGRSDTDAREQRDCTGNA